LIEDVAIMAGLADFFAAKLQAGVLYALWRKNGDPALGQEAVRLYRMARATWAGMAERAKSVYAADVAYGEIPQRRGHWSDRLAAIDADIAAMRKTVAAAAAGGASSGDFARKVTVPDARFTAAVRHLVPGHFAPGADLPLVMTAGEGVSAQLFYRHVNHGERWRSLPMSEVGDTLRGAIPGAYTGSPYPLQYYFVLQKGAQATLYPGFNASFSNQPYFAVWKRN
jgi:hypothetical protein